MLNKAIAFLALVFGLTACGSASNSEQPSPATSTTTSQAVSVKEAAWDKLVKRAQACGPTPLLDVEMATIKPEEVLVIYITSKDASQNMSVMPWYGGETWQTNAYYTLDTTGVKYTTHIGDGGGFDGSENASERAERTVIAQNLFGTLLDAIGCAS